MIYVKLDQDSCSDKLSVTSSYSQNRINKSNNRVLKCSTVCKTTVKTKSKCNFLVYLNLVHLGFSKNLTNLFHTFSNSINFIINSGQMQNKRYHQPMWHSRDGMFIIMCNVSFPIKCKRDFLILSYNNGFLLA